MSKEEPTLGYSYHLPSGGFGLRIRNALAQFSDIFSEFNKYIAPAYHHDRCERSVQMRMYSMHKREFVLVFVGIFAMFGLATFIGLAGPPIALVTEMKASNLPRKSGESEFTRGPFVLKSPTLNTYNQQLWVIGKITTDNVEGLDGEAPEEGHGAEAGRAAGEDARVGAVRSARPGEISGSPTDRFVTPESLTPRLKVKFSSSYERFSSSSSVPSSPACASSEAYPRSPTRGTLSRRHR